MFIRLEHPAALIGSIRSKMRMERLLLGRATAASTRTQAGFGMIPVRVTHCIRGDITIPIHFSVRT
jgi:hypothetical protein